MVSNNNTG